MRVLICGSRSWTNLTLISTYIQNIGATLIIHGNARGADRLAGQIASQLNIPVEVYLPDWDKYGKGAGFIRNREMLEKGKPDLVLAFWDGESNGTRNMIELGEGAKVPTLVIMDDMAKGSETSTSDTADHIDEEEEQGVLEQAFWTFHTAHPEIYQLLVRFALEWRQSEGPGAPLGIGALFERVRWEIHLKSLANKTSPKLNNNHRAFYSRLLMKNVQELEGIFRLRQQTIQTTFGPDNQELPPNEQIVGP